MRKLMTTTLTGAILAGFSMGMVGCTEESAVETKTQVKTPDGTATRTDKTTIDKTGKNPPSVPGDSKAP